MTGRICWPIKDIYKKTSRLPGLEYEFPAKVIQRQKFLSIFSKQLIIRDFEFLTGYDKVLVKVVKAYNCTLQLRLRNKNRNHIFYLHLTSIVLDCKIVRIFAFSSARKQSNKRSGTRLKTESETIGRDASHACEACVKLLRHALPISFLILRKNPTAVQSTIVPLTISPCINKRKGENGGVFGGGPNPP